MRNDMNRGESIERFSLGKSQNYSLIRGIWEFSSQSRGLRYLQQRLEFMYREAAAQSSSDTETKAKSLMSKIFIAFALLSATFWGTVF
jgi:hypothetical protein